MRPMPLCFALLSASISAFAMPAAAAELCPAGTVKAKVVAIDQAWAWNRYGALQPHGMMFALKRDVRPVSELGCAALGKAGAEEDADLLEPGKVVLRPDKRPRPLVLRVNRDQCLEVELTNLLDSQPRNRFQSDRPEHAKCHQGQDDPFAEGCGDQTGERWVGFHPNGLELVKSSRDDGSHVGDNPSSLVAPGESITYTFAARHEGTFFVYSPASTTGGDGNGGSIFAGLFGAVNVEPKGSTWYRSQVRQDELKKALRSDSPQQGYPRIDYAKLRILGEDNEIRHSDLTAIVDTRDLPDDAFESARERDCRGASEAERDPRLCADPRQPFREFTIIFHDESGAVQAFEEFDATQSEKSCELDEESEACRLARATEDILQSARDGFAINYGTAGIGAEVLANRKKLGPVRDCPECMMEEFFLSSWAVGDPAMVVDRPASLQLKDRCYLPENSGKPTCRPKGVYFPDDPSNVYHSYLNDRVVFRNLHAGPKEHHVFHLHAHQWLQTQYNQRSTYLDSQTIGPGGTYTYEIAYGGSGNRNRTVGDSIFHCHFYPHFAQGMWSLWRVHDVFEAGTELESRDWEQSCLAVPRPKARALPDGEIAAGSPIPALVPMPKYALAPLPGPVEIQNGQLVPLAIAESDEPPLDGYPGYPFFIPGKAGHRPPEPPLDMLSDGGLQRHIVKSGEVDAAPLVEGNSRSLHKEWVSLTPEYLDEAGTAAERQAMHFHRLEKRTTADAEGNSVDFHTNGQPARRGAPYADPCPPTVENTKVFQAAAFQLDLVFNKKGWHTPQARLLALRDDVHPTLDGSRAPQPLFFRVNSGDCVEFQHSNLVPRVWKQDAFQIETPTDIIGQHIHLVKFDVTSSDGSGNGFNYEDGTASYQEVQQRIKAIRRANHCSFWSWPWAAGTPACPKVEKHPWYGWKYPGGRVTVQRWYADPQLIPTDTRQADGTFVEDKTLETVFTHDHFGPSTHQQAGLYAGLIVEPKGSTYTYQDIDLKKKRQDGGPTSWKAVVAVPAGGRTLKFREFGILYQDFLIAYEKGNDTRKAINAPGQVAADERQPKHLVEWDERCTTWPHCPEAVSADDTGVMSINYRSEPAPLRLLDENRRLAAGDQGDLAFLFQSIERSDDALNREPRRYPLVGGISRSSWPVLTPGMKRHDPFTPLMEVYDDEVFKIRLLAGAHEHEHSFTLNGINWRFMADERDSGERGFLTSALSEHHEIDGVLRIPTAFIQKVDESSAWIPTADEQSTFDHLFKIGASVDDTWYGNWGILRAYRRNHPQAHLPVLPLEEMPMPERLGDAAGPTTLKARSEDRSPMNRRELIAKFQREYLSDYEEVERRAPADAGIGRLAAPGTAAPEDEFDRRLNLLQGILEDAVGSEAASLQPRAAFRLPAPAATDAEREVMDALSEEVEDFKETLDLVSASLAKARRDEAFAAQPEPPELAARRSFSELRTVEELQEAQADLTEKRALFPKIVDVPDENPDLGGLPVCPEEAPLRAFDISAVAAREVLDDGKLIYHRFPGDLSPQGEKWHSVNDPTALLYVRSRDLEGGKLRERYKVEPLILRARAGDCIEIHLTNALPTEPADLAGYNTLPNIVPRFNFNQLEVSSQVGIHVQGLRYHSGESDGINVGVNPRQTVGPGEKKIYRYYAGRVQMEESGLVFKPVELGVLNILPADPIKQNSKGLIGALVIEPPGSVWRFDRVDPEPHSGKTFELVSRAGATVFSRVDGKWRKVFRDLVLVGQNDVNFRLDTSRRFSGMRSRPVRRVAMAAGCGTEGCFEADVRDEEVDAVDTGHKAFNYRSEALWMRRGIPAATPLAHTLELPAHDVLADSFVGGDINQTPRFCLRPGAPTRLRIAFPGGHGRNHILQVHGHSFQELPFLEDSTVLGENDWSFYKGSQDGFGPGSYFNFLLSGGAGGIHRVEADYLIRDQYSWGFDNGLWAVLDVSAGCSE